MMKKSNLLNSSLWIGAILITFLLAFFLLKFKSSTDSNADIIIGLASILGSVATAVTVIFLVIQIRQQIKKNNTELIFNLYHEFYSDSSFSNIFSLIDFDHSMMCDEEISLNEVLEIIIDSEPFNTEQVQRKNNIENRFNIRLPKEIELCNYMNFFNSFGELIKVNKEVKQPFDNIFKYQLNKTLLHPTLLNYIYDGKFLGFLSFEREVIIPFFFYGTLKEPSERVKNIGEWNWSQNEKCILNGYSTVDISDPFGTYPALVRDGSNSVGGVYTEIKVKDFFKFFDVIDLYEEVGTLYERRLDWVYIKDTLEKKLCWIYCKK